MNNSQVSVNKNKKEELALFEISSTVVVDYEIVSTDWIPEDRSILEVRTWNNIYFKIMALSQ